MVTAAPAQDAALRLLRDRFLNRTDLVAILAPWGKPCPVEADGLLDQLLLGHLLGEAAPVAKVRYTNRRGSGAMSGRFRVGSYCPSLADTTRWLCLDFDGKGHANALTDPLAAAGAAYDAFTAVGLPVYLERSGGGQGWHLWCFFEPEIPAEKAQALGRALAPKDALLVDGRRADATSNRGIEVFPKQKSRRSGFGNLVWLPWWQGAPAGANTFYRRSQSGEFEPFTPAEFAAATPEAVDTLLASIGQVASSNANANVAVALAPEPERAAPDPAAHGTNDPAWTDWRRRALAALPLDRIFGIWLTGKSAGAGWLECRDPASPTGDEHPSASVANGTGNAERGTFHSFISGRTLSVFDFLVEHGGVADFRAARARIAEFSGVPEPRASAPEAQPIRPRPRRPQIQVNSRLLDYIVEDAWQAVLAASRRSPKAFMRHGSLVHVAYNDLGCRIEPMTEVLVYAHLTHVAEWVRVTPDSVVYTSPSEKAARVMFQEPSLSLPILEGIVRTPVFAPDGALVSAPGYHAGARLWYDREEGFEIPAVPEKPNDEDVAQARSLLLDDLLIDFPFAAASDRAHAVATLLLPFVRLMIKGCTPIHLVEAPTPGSGKGLLADLVSIIAVGRTCEPTTFTAAEDETRKKITAILTKAQPVVLIDNIKDGLESNQLAAALTAERWSDRILGETRMVDLPNTATWIVTGNNLNLSTDIARRCARIRIEPKVDRPWRRTGFKHDPLRDWVRANRVRLVHAVLVLVRAWTAAGQPAGKVTLGSFENWARVIGGILECAKIPGLLEDSEELYEVADAEGQEWRGFVNCWWEAHRDRWVTTTELLDLALKAEILGSVIGDKSPLSQRIRMGKALSAVRDRQFANKTIVVSRNSNTKAAQYRLTEPDNGKPNDPCELPVGQLELVPDDE